MRFRIRNASIGSARHVLRTALVLWSVGLAHGQQAAVPDSTLQLTVEGQTATFSTRTMIVEVKRGIVVRLFNRVTGTEYILGGGGQGTSDASTGLIYAQPSVSQGRALPNTIGPGLVEKGETILTPTLLRLDQLPQFSMKRVGPLAVQYEFRLNTGDPTLTIEYALDPATDDLTVQEKAEGQRGGLAALRWGLGPVTVHGNLLIPAFNGIKATRPESQYKFESSTWGWPMGWQVPIVVFADVAGGFSVHTEDASLRFKEMMYQPSGSSWNVAFSSVNQAPFGDTRSSEGLTWRVNTFTGNWSVPVDRYKNWAYRAFRIAEKEKYRPAWIDGIRLVIKHADYLPDAQTVQFLDELRKYVKPSETLLFATFWKDDEKKQPLPYWLPNAHGVNFAREARRRGFRVMYFTNYIGIMPQHPKFSDFKDHIIRDPYSGKMQGWNLAGEWSRWNIRGDRSPESDVKLYYVNPAYKPWRDYQIAQFKQLFEQSPADGLFLDQAFLIFNDGNGLVNDLDTIHANLEFHREIAEALPGVALGGESINEITMQYESFCELHFLSLDLKDGSGGEPVGWRLDPAAFDRMVPLTTRYVSPHTRPIGYVGFPETRSPYYESWRDALRVYGGIATITRPTLEELGNENSEVRRVMRLAFPDSER